MVLYSIVFLVGRSPISFRPKQSIKCRKPTFSNFDKKENDFLSIFPVDHIIVLANSFHHQPNIVCRKDTIEVVNKRVESEQMFLCILFNCGTDR